MATGNNIIIMEDIAVVPVVILITVTTRQLSARTSIEVFLLFANSDF